jgi:hypothetical protein
MRNIKNQRRRKENEIKYKYRKKGEKKERNETIKFFSGLRTVLTKANAQSI